MVQFYPVPSWMRGDIKRLGTQSNRGLQSSLSIPQPQFRGALDELDQFHHARKAAQEAEKVAAEERRQQSITQQQALVRQNAKASFLNSDKVQTLMARLNESFTEHLDQKSIVLTGWDILEGIQQDQSISGFLEKLSPPNQARAQQLVSDLDKRCVISPSPQKGWTAMPMSANVEDGMYKLNLQTRSFDLVMDPPAIATLERERETPEQTALRKRQEADRERSAQAFSYWESQRNASDYEGQESPTCCVSDDDPRNHHTNPSPGEEFGRWRDSYRQFDD